jgi:hypothetical protein
VPSGVKGFEDDVGVAVDVSVCAGDVVEIHIEECNTYEEILSAITDWTEYYNYERYQWDLAKLSPAEYYKYLKTGEYPLQIPKPNGFKES